MRYGFFDSVSYSDAAPHVLSVGSHADGQVALAIDGWRGEVTLGRRIADTGQDAAQPGLRVDIVVQLVVSRADKQQCHAVQVCFGKVSLFPSERQGLDVVAHQWGNDGDSRSEAAEYRSLMGCHTATTDYQDAGIADAYVDR